MDLLSVLHAIIEKIGKIKLIDIGSATALNSVSIVVGFMCGATVYQATDDHKDYWNIWFDVMIIYQSINVEIELDSNLRTCKF